MHYTVTASEKLSEFAAQFVSCGPEGLPSETEASNVIEAMFDVINCSPLEMLCDLTGEWIELKEVETGSVYRHVFTRNPDFADYIGEFEYGGKTFTGTKNPLEGEEGDALPTTEYSVFVRLPSVKVKAGYYDFEEILTEFMPTWYVEELLDEMVADHEDALEEASTDH